MPRAFSSTRSSPSVANWESPEGVCILLGRKLEHVANTQGRMEAMLHEIRTMQQNMAYHIIQQLREDAVAPGWRTGTSGPGGPMPSRAATKSWEGKASLGQLSDCRCPTDGDNYPPTQAACADQRIPNTHAELVDGSVSPAPQRLEGDEHLSNPERGRTQSDIARKSTVMDSISSGNDAEMCVKSCDGDLIPPTLPRDWPMSLGMRPELCRTSRRLQTEPLTTLQHALWSSSCQLQSSSMLHLDTPKKTYILMPGSRLHVGWSFVTFLVLVCDLITNPVILAWDVEVQGLLEMLSLLSVFCWTLDMVLSFFTGIYQAGELQTSLMVIAKHYLLSWFCFDIFIVMGDWANLVVRAVDGTRGGSAGILKVFVVIKVGRFLRTLRVLRLMRFIHVFLEKQMLGSANVLLKTVSVLVGTGMLIHLISCFWFLVGRMAPSDTGDHWTGVFEMDGPLAHTDALYQYFVAVHWAAAQLTLGATDISSTSSLERLFNVVCMLIGLMYGCTLVSSLSATMVEMQMNHKEKHQNMAKLIKYLKENMISPGTRMLVQEKVQERLKQTQNFESETPAMLNLLSVSLYTQLRLEVFQACISSHPLLTICKVAHPLTMQRLCREAMELEHLQTEDELFEAGREIKQAYYLVHGQLQYTQSPDSAAVTSFVERTADAGSWLCQAALWGQWVTVGTVVAKTPCKLIVLRAEPLIEIMSGHPIIATIAVAYAQAFHSQLCLAHPGVSAYPSDLEVPHTSFEEVATVMSQKAQQAMGHIAIRGVSTAYGANIRKTRKSGSSMWAVPGLGGRGPCNLELLEEEVNLGQSVVFLNKSAELERVVVATKVRIMNSRGKVLVEIGERDKEGLVTSTFNLPRTRVMRDEEPREAFRRVLDTQIPKLAGKVDFLSTEQETTKEISAMFNVSTTCIFSICHANLLQEGQQSVGNTHYSMSFFPRSGLRRSSGGRVLKELEGDALAALRHATLYKVEDSDGNARLYCWLCPAIFARAGKALNYESITELLGFVFTQMEGKDSADDSDDSDHMDSLKI